MQSSQNQALSVCVQGKKCEECFLLCFRHVVNGCADRAGSVWDTLLCWEDVYWCGGAWRGPQVNNPLTAGQGCQNLASSSCVLLLNFQQQVFDYLLNQLLTYYTTLFGVVISFITFVIEHHSMAAVSGENPFLPNKPVPVILTLETSLLSSQPDACFWRLSVYSVWLNVAWILIITRIDIQQMKSGLRHG